MFALLDAFSDGGIAAEPLAWVARADLAPDASWRCDDPALTPLALHAQCSECDECGARSRARREFRKSPEGDPGEDEERGEGRKYEIEIGMELERSNP